MASIGNDPGGRRRILFECPTSGKRKTLRLGQCDLKAAQSIRVHVEHLLTSKLTGTAPPQATAAWLSALSPTLRERLVAVGLTDPLPRVPTVRDWCRQYIASRTDLAPRSVARLEHATRLMCEFFGDDRPIDRITPADAEAYSRWSKLGQAPNTIRKRVAWAKQFLRAAIKARILTHNPFDGLAANTRPDRSRDCFIDRDTMAKLLDACPDAEWRGILALARYGGLRCPSEVLALEWGHILWDRDRMTVPCVKTASTTGEAYRLVPLFPELRDILAELFELAPEGSRYVITRYRSAETNLRTQFGRICRKAGVPMPPKPFVNLRASKATELVENYPSHVAAAWLGHSEKIADAHYRQVNEQHFARAVAVNRDGDSPHPTSSAAQNPAQQMAAEQRTVTQAPPVGLAKPPDFLGDFASVRLDATQCKSVQYTQKDSNLQPSVP